MAQILIAPDKFKGSLSAFEVASSIAAGLEEGGFTGEIQQLPIADGGEGTMDAVACTFDVEWVACPTTDALGRTVEARYLLLDRGRKAVVEMSQAAGMWRISADDRDAWRASTAGVGTMLRHVFQQPHVEEVLLGLGGSATNDGGSGCAQALGYRFLNATGEEVAIPEDLLSVTRVERPEKTWPGRVIAACDVQNPLLGAEGASAVYGPQKGVSSDELPQQEARLRHLEGLLRTHFGWEESKTPGAGAAGGFGWAVKTFLGGDLISGFQWIAGVLDLESAIAEADLVITGEGSMDEQTLSGKGPHGVACLARRLGKPTLAFCGRRDSSPALDEAFDEIVSLVRADRTVEESIRNAASYLQAAAEQVARAKYR
ncbi:MAG: glycerate kinase [Verrucomicrobiota bacterium]